MQGAETAPRDRTRLFIAVAFVISYLGQLLIWMKGGIDSAAFNAIAPVLMFSPALGAFIALRAERVPIRSVLRGAGSLHHYVIAIVVPAVTAMVTAVVAHVWLGADPLPLTLQGSTVVIPDRSPFFGSGEQSFVIFVLNFLATSTWYAAIAGLLTVGEEIGWRGYLQPRWTARLGRRRGIVAVGIAWWIWHVPILLQGYVFPASPVSGALVLFPIVAVMLSFFLGWLRDQSRSIWPAVAAHGSYNAAFATIVFRMEFGARPVAAYGLIVALTALTGLVFALLPSRPISEVPVTG